MLIRFSRCARILALATLTAAVPALVAQAKVNDDQARKIQEAAPAQARVTPTGKHRVLVFTRAAGFKHSSIPHGAMAVAAMGKKSGAFEAVISDDLTLFDEPNIKQFQGIVLVNTTGPWIRPRPADLTKLSADKSTAKAVETRLQQSLLNWVRAGGGLAGFHAASDANYHWPQFGRLIGGWFNAHPWHEDVGITLEQANHPLMAAFKGQDFVIKDEIYQFKDPYARDNVRVLLKLDTSRTNMNKKNIRRTDGDFAVAWVRSEGKGRVFYSSLGHREEIYWNPTIMQFYLDGIQFALGDLDADTTPSAALGAKPTAAAATASGWTMLFDGKNLDHWKLKPGGWTIEDGTMARQPKGGYAWTKQAYGDFELDLEFKVSKGCNSGIFFRTDPRNAVQGGFEIQVLDSHGKKNVGKHDCGALYDALAPSTNAVKPAGEWNHYRMTAKGPKIQVVINGKQVIDANLDDWKTPKQNPDGSKNKFKTALKDLPRTGHIGFQDHGKPVWYRKVKIRPL
ncbi:MAG: DUF1080 domain-containing protein [Phycisphaerae bacterium]|nr:DUF1080 domain-containing protein [Phycisphaerae bacterium]